ncbi:MAG: hypothetical protein E7B59_14195 [Enterobacteriaceae bacterium]|nr:hypothetical protein [Enterobacteriaceae bacterium]
MHVERSKIQACASVAPPGIISRCNVCQLTGWEVVATVMGIIALAIRFVAKRRIIIATRSAR